MAGHGSDLVRRRSSLRASAIAGRPSPWLVLANSVERERKTRWTIRDIVGSLFGLEERHYPSLLA